jgi:glycine cleavage system H protein
MVQSYKKKSVYILPSVNKTVTLRPKPFILNCYMNFPEKIKYTKSHEWISVDIFKSFVGITDYAQSELGEIVFVDVNTVGQIINKGEVFGSIEAVKTVSDLLMPVTGKIIEVNKNLEEHPEYVNEEPYGAGWLVLIEVIDRSEVKDLMNTAAYRSFVGK